MDTLLRIVVITLFIPSIGLAAEQSQTLHIDLQNTAYWECHKDFKNCQPATHTGPNGSIIIKFEDDSWSFRNDYPNDHGFMKNSCPEHWRRNDSKFNFRECKTEDNGSVVKFLFFGAAVKNPKNWSQTIGVINFQAKTFDWMGRSVNGNEYVVSRATGRFN